MKPRKRNRQPSNSLRSGAEKRATSKRPNVSKNHVHSDPKRPMAPRGNPNIFAAGSHLTQVTVDESIASNQNQSDRAELDPKTVVIPLSSSSRVLMSSTDSQRPVNHIPESIPSLCHPIGAHLPLKIKEKIGRGEFSYVGLLLKSAAVLGSDSTLDGDFVLKRGALTVVNKKPDSLNIEIWPL
ncbi:Hypothetical predicted protein [Mytilus galloprovincialis]|uniref:Uncharacterized protein n=1 Tax=Mytilus galloprovincialis TaxID=29158 RepID=A0A8B6FBR4_MYTGA|nr:Hypothetical predicted protein [Mytilus galloprovincialis]